MGTSVAGDLDGPSVVVGCVGPSVLVGILVSIDSMVTSAQP